MSAGALLALANEVEQLTEPCRDVDLKILRAISGKHWLWHRPPDTTAVWWNQYGAGAPGNPLCTLERFTASIDDAMQLIPKGAQWTVEADSAWVRWIGRKDVEEAQSVL